MYRPSDLLAGPRGGTSRLFFSWMGASSNGEPLGSEIVPVSEPFSSWAQTDATNASEQATSNRRDIVIDRGYHAGCAPYSWVCDIKVRVFGKGRRTGVRWGCALGTRGFKPRFSLRSTRASLARCRTVRLYRVTHPSTFAQNREPVRCSRRFAACALLPIHNWTPHLAPLQPSRSGRHRVRNPAGDGNPWPIIFSRHAFRPICQKRG